MINDIFLWMMAVPQFWLQVMWVGSIVIPIVIAGVFANLALDAEPVWAFEIVNDIKEHFGVEE